MTEDSLPFGVDLPAGTANGDAVAANVREFGRYFGGQDWLSIRVGP